MDALNDRMFFRMKPAVIITLILSALGWILTIFAQ